jgi:exonuclease III
MCFMDPQNILIWNVCGLNSRAHHHVVTDLVTQERISLLCLEETKIHVIENQFINAMLGPSFDYASLLANGTHGGILVAWRSAIWNASQVHQSHNVLTLRLIMLPSATPWWITVLYGPQIEQDKVTFLDELQGIRSRKVGQ